MAVHPQDAAHEFLAEAVHHRHDDDQGRHAQGDTQEGEAGDNRDETLLAAGAQVAQGHHPFEGTEDHGPAAALTP
jgi:hypothetical protein